MDIMMMIMAVLLLGVCVIIVFLVLSQDTKGGGLAGALGGSSVQSAFGGRSSESIAKITAWIGVAFFVLILAMNIMKPRSTLGLRDTTAPTTNTPATSTPAAPTAPAPR